MSLDEYVRQKKLGKHQSEICSRRSKTGVRGRRPRWGWNVKRAGVFPSLDILAELSVQSFLTDAQTRRPATNFIYYYDEFSLFWDQQLCNKCHPKGTCFFRCLQRGSARQNLL